MDAIDDIADILNPKELFTDSKIEEDDQTIMDQIDAWLDTQFPDNFPKDYILKLQDYILKILSEKLLDSASRNSIHINLP
jgi:hypothetical protein